MFERKGMAKALAISTCFDAFRFRVPPLRSSERSLSDLGQARRSRYCIGLIGAEREISLLREYRTRLIADVVTGKLDVREAAARLPDEAPEAEPLDEIEDVPQDEVAAEDEDLEAADAA